MLDELEPEVRQAFLACLRADVCDAARAIREATGESLVSCASHMRDLVAAPGFSEMEAYCTALVERQRAFIMSDFEAILSRTLELM